MIEQVSKKRDPKMEIVEASIKLFNEQGLKTGPKKICEMANVAKGTLYHHFKGKEDLIIKSYISVKKELISIMETAIDQNVTHEENFKNIWKQTIFWGIENQEKFRFIELVSSSPFVKKIPQDEINEANMPLVNLYNTGIENGFLRRVNIKIAVKSIFFTLKGTILQLINNECIISRDEIINQSFDLLWNGLAN